MPLYEYRCKKCNSDFELLIRSDEAPECPGCGSRKLEKQLSVPAAHTSGVNQLPMCETAPQGCCPPECGVGECPMRG